MWCTPIAGHVPGVGQAAGDRGPDQQRPDQAGPAGVGDAVEGLRATARLDRFLQQWQ